MGNTAKQCRLGLFQDSDFAGDLEGPKSTSGGTLCVLGSHTFVPISWICKKQTSVSHNSTESESAHLFGRWNWTGVSRSRFVGSDCFSLWETTQNHDRTVKPVVNCDRDRGHNKRSQGMINVLNNIDCFPSNDQFSHQEALLYVFEDNEAVIKMNIKGRSPTIETCFQDPQSCA